ncbi:MAG: hypothetical protein NPINA01_13170 [Nitrospinaceae bacterium]|nr:MAG: hypothetical protein NPINA01_13170 [Nitrospinaceae bacterium]
MSDNNRFIDNGDGTVTDSEKNLMWKKSDSMGDLAKWVNYQESADYARELNEQKFAGYDNWRLPTRDELCTIYDKAWSVKDKFGKDIHINDCFAPGGGFSMVAQQVPGRMRTWVFNLRDGEYTQPDGLWTLAEAARAVRNIDNQ